jgi:hypothetical protein
VPATLRPALAISALALLLVGLHVRAYTLTSPIDELVHIDYLFRAASGNLVRVGDMVGERAMREEACRGKDSLGAAANPAERIPPCSQTVLRPEEFPGQGWNTAYGHPPTYYVVTGVLGRGLMVVTGIDSLVTAGRVLGAAWLAAGLGSCWAAGRRLGAGALPLAGALALVASTPSVLYASSTINPDAASLAVGGAVLLAVLSWEERSRRLGRGLGWLFAAGLFAGGVKLTNLVAVMAGGLYLLGRGLLPTGDPHWQAPWQSAGQAPWPPPGERPGGERSGQTDPAARPAAPPAASWQRRWPFAAHLGATAALGAGALLATAGWLAFVRAEALIDPASLPMSGRFAIEGIGVAQVLGEIGTFVTPVKGAFVAFVLNDLAVNLFLQVYGWLLLASVLGSVLIAAQAQRLRILAGAHLATMIAGGPLFVLMNFYAQGAYVQPLPPRYAMSLLVGLSALLAATVRERWLALGLAALGAASVASVAYPLLGG